MTRSHERSGSWVTDHYRNGSYVEGHWRSGTIVDEYGGTPTKRSSRWFIDQPDRPLVFATTCWYCDARVFFVRNSSGGCFLCHSLGWPWPIHGCWAKYRGDLLRRTERELRTKGYNGAFLPPDGPRIRCGSHAQTTSFVGFIADNHALYSDPLALNLRGNRRATTHTVMRVDISTVSGALCCTWIPKAVASELADYASVVVEATWLQRKKRKLLLANSIQILPSDEPEGLTYRCVSRGVLCSGCGLPIRRSENWGLNPSARLECSLCATRRLRKS